MVRAPQSAQALRQLGETELAVKREGEASRRISRGERSCVVGWPIMVPPISAGRHSVQGRTFAHRPEPEFAIQGNDQRTATALASAGTAAASGRDSFAASVPPGTISTCTSWRPRSMSPSFLAHVRATSMATVQESNCHPFRYGHWLFVHNGEIEEIRKVSPRSAIWRVAPQFFPPRAGDNRLGADVLPGAHAGAGGRSDRRARADGGIRRTDGGRIRVSTSRCG